ncbi:MAG: phosphotransferase [Candidatus Eisenbacteria bacterium]
MKSFEDLSYRGQVDRLKAMGEEALREFGVRSPSLKHIAHAENTTFEVRSSRGGVGRAPRGPYVPGRYLLRIHRPGYQSESSVRSELKWLAALRRDLDLHVPDPVVGHRGRSTVVVGVEGVPEERVCSLLRWMDGSQKGKKGERPVHVRHVGSVMAKLHAHASAWRRPAAFDRGSWDWKGLFESAGAAGTDESWVWDALGEKERRLYELSARNTADAVDELGDGGDAVGLIHADLHLGNVLFGGGEARPIDFDDAGFGYWLYDMAVVLHDYRRREDWAVWRDALLKGYAAERPLPEGVDQHLDTFMCARCVSLMLWCHARARENPHFRKHLKTWVDWSIEYLSEFCSE